MSFKKNESAVIHFSMRDLGGQLPEATLSLTNTDCKVRKDSGNFGNATNAPSEDSAKYGHYALSLTASELNADAVSVLIQKSGYRDFEITIYPEPKMIDDLQDLTAAQVNSECDTALTDYDGPTNAEMAAGQAAVVTSIIGADGDDLKDISDQIDAIATAAGQPSID